MTRSMPTLSTDWHTQPEAIALFARAYAVCGDGAAQFPYDIEAQLEVLADGEDVIAAWDRYCAMRESADLVLA